MRRAFLLPALVCVLILAPLAFPQEKDIPEGFTPLFNGKDLSGWKVLGGPMDLWGAEDGVLFTRRGGGGWLMTEKEFSNFELRLLFKVPVHGNSGVALRAPLEGNVSYTGMEIQIIDDPGWEGLKSWQHTGSIYGVVPASRQVNKPTGEWNSMRIVAKGPHISVEVNDVKIVDANLNDYKDHAAEHPGILRHSGHLGLQSHDGRVEFRNVWVKPL